MCLLIVTFNCMGIESLIRTCDTKLFASPCFYIKSIDKTDSQFLQSSESSQRVTSLKSSKLHSFEGMWLLGTWRSLGLGVGIRS
jgi:hypothetical protein